MTHLLVRAVLLSALTLPLAPDARAALGRVGLAVPQADPSCRTRVGLRDDVAALLGRDPFHEGHRAPRIEIRFAQTEAGYVAEVELQGGPGFRGTRRLAEARAECADLTEPVALIIAMAIEEAEAVGALTPTRRPGEQSAAVAPRRAPAQTPELVRAPPRAPWRVSIGPSISSHLLEAPGPSLGGGVELRLTREALALQMGFRASRSLGANGIAGTTLVAEIHTCLMTGPFDLCAGLAGGMQSFDAEGLTPLSPPTITAHLVPTLGVAARIEMRDIILRPSLELGAPIVRPNVTRDAASLFAAPGVTFGIRLALLFRTSPSD